MGWQELGWPQASELLGACPAHPEASPWFPRSAVLAGPRPQLTSHSLCWPGVRIFQECNLLTVTGVS